MLFVIPAARRHFDLQFVNTFFQSFPDLYISVRAIDFEILFTALLVDTLQSVCQGTFRSCHLHRLTALYDLILFLKQLSAIEYEIKQRNVTFEQITQNLTDALDLLDDCVTFYRNSSDTIKRLLNQAIFEKIYISCEKGSPVKVEAEFNPPYDMLVEPFKDELVKVNRAIRMSPDKTIEKMKKAKDRILKNLRCGLSDSENKEPYSEADYFYLQIRE